MCDKFVFGWFVAYFISVKFSDYDIIQFEKFSNIRSCTTDRDNVTDNGSHYAARKVRSSTWP